MAKEPTQTQQQSSSSSTQPWTAAQPLLEKLLSAYGGMNTNLTSTQQGAVNDLNASATGIPGFGGSASDAISKMFGSSTDPQIGMLKNTLSQLQGNIGGTASGAELNPYNTPGFSDALNTMTQNITNATKGVYAGSGRDPAGAGSFAKSLGLGLTQGEAPVISAQYNANKQNQLNAANSLFGAGTGTAGAITGQQQVPFSNFAQAIGLLPSASSAYTLPGQTELGASNAAYQAPYGNLMALLGPALGLGGMGSQSQGSATGTVSQSQSPFSTALGGISTGLGLLSMF